MPASPGQFRPPSVASSTPVQADRLSYLRRPTPPTPTHPTPVPTPAPAQPAKPVATFTTLSSVELGNGKLFALVATVRTQTGAIPYGTVNFTLSGTIIAVKTLDSTGVATLPLPSLNFVPSSAGATYSGNSAFSPSTSN